MDTVADFLATGDVREVDAYKGLLGDVEVRSWCHYCGVKPDRLMQVTKGVHQFHFCRICAFTKRDAVELFYQLRPWLRRT